MDSEKERWRDNEFPILIANILGVDFASLPLKIEGGNLLSNGDGVCVATASVVARNAARGYTPQHIARLLRKHCGISSWSYLVPPIGESNRHADMFMVFLAANVAVVSEVEPTIDPSNASILDDAAAVVGDLKTSRGPMQDHRIPLPRPKDGFFRSYTNIMLVNGVLLFPSDSDVDRLIEAKALAVYRELLPDWEIIPIGADAWNRTGPAWVVSRISENRHCSCQCSGSRAPTR